MLVRGAGSIDGTVVRALASHQSGPDSFTGLDVMWVEFVVGSHPYSGGIFPGTLTTVENRNFLWDHAEHVYWHLALPKNIMLDYDN